ncbi:MAG: hypothetical protein NC187_03360 [Candidatus Amulumruptor caecigallinarius]|nr:hypothetical protein [Candidatus Amulumruptor caecigallinarius]MCM1396508.1 hypothetical protein [Candidatus Amulumruptor caecigallinarius]MCM1453434.1 hypothetical protein [bacterium]
MTKGVLLTTATVLAVVTVGVCTPLKAERVVCDDACKIEFQHPADSLPPEGALTVGEASYAVVSPVGRGTVEMISMAPRLSTLDGKTIALVGGSFMASITHPELKRLILEHYPTAKVLLLDEIGAAGVYPAPGVTRRAKDEFQRRLRELKVDAVISGNCGCGLCTPKEVGSCIAAEYVGVPSVAIAAPGFVNEVYYTSINNGVPAPRVAEYPGAFASHTTEELVRNTRERVWPQVVKALTTPVSEAELAANQVRDRGDVRDDVFYGTLQEVNEHFADMKWSDGLPIVPPTLERVEEFLRYTDLAWDSTVAVLPVAHRNTLAWHVAVNGVMAGCKPEYMPILVAITEAMGDGNFRRTIASTHGWMPYAWLNGPLMRQLGICDGQGAISGEANARLGRFINLALMNLAGYYVGEGRMGTFGYPMPWCLAEDEAACVAAGWQPYHVRKGYALEDNTLTLTSALQWGNNMAPSTTDPEMLMELLAMDIAERGQFALGSGKQFTPRTILLTSPVAQILAKGYATPEALEADLVRHARKPLKERVFANYYANPGSNPEERHPLSHWRGHLKRTEGAQETATPVWHDSEAETLMTVATMKEGMTAFVVTGDPSRNKVQTMPGGGFATVKIRLPRKWDELMAERGYAPLEACRLHTESR